MALSPVEDSLMNAASPNDAVFTRWGLLFDLRLFPKGAKPTTRNLAALVELKMNTFKWLEAKYSEGWRSYHTMHHVRDLLDKLDHVHELVMAHDSKEVSRAEAETLITLAILFHDVVYDVGPAVKAPGQNERLSADAFLDFCAKAEKHDSCGSWIRHKHRVANWILATANHTKAPHGVDLDLDLFLDLDMSILGEDPRAYETYVEQIRAEYKHLSDEEFRRGRAQVLRTFLAEGPRLFRRPEMRSELAKAALDNMKRELAALERGPPASKQPPSNASKL